jgi:hypothetical protein
MHAPDVNSNLLESKILESHGKLHNANTRAVEISLDLNLRP